MNYLIITGGAGFIGSNIAAQLGKDAGLDVVIVDKLGKASSNKWRNLSKAPLHDVIAPRRLFSFLDDHSRSIAAIIHMGAISSTIEENVDLIMRTNLSLTARIWDWCALKQAPLIYASSAAVYGKGEQGFEDSEEIATLSTHRPLNAYGWSKKLADLYILKQKLRGYEPPFWAGLRFFNVYGPNEYHKGNMKSVVSQIYPLAKNGEPVELFQSHHPDYEDGGQLRDFVSIFDCIHIIDWLFNNQVNAGLLNIGSGKARSFKDLVEAVFAAIGQQPQIRYIPTPEAIRPNYQYFTQSDDRKLRQLGYETGVLSLEDGVSQYVKDFLEKDDPYR